MKYKKVAHLIKLNWTICIINYFHPHQKEFPELQMWEGDYATFNTMNESLTTIHIPVNEIQ